MPREERGRPGGLRYCFRPVRQHADVVGGHLQPAARDVERAALTAHTVSELARAEFGEQGGVARQDAHVAVGRRGLGTGTLVSRYQRR